MCQKSFVWHCTLGSITGFRLLQVVVSATTSRIQVAVTFDKLVSHCGTQSIDVRYQCEDLYSCTDRMTDM